MKKLLYPFAAIVFAMLSALSCAALNALTAHLTLNIIALPLLWCALLAIFLLLCL